MNINGKTRIFGVTGDPVGHSLSPDLHNAVFRKRGVNAVYAAFKVRPDDLYCAVEGFRAINAGGISVTVPHKEQAAQFVDAMPNPTDKAVGAVNTLVFAEGRILGFNTDGSGFMADMRERFDFKAEGKTILILGAGGAARALAFTFMASSCAKLYIHNRTAQRARGLAEFLSGFFSVGEVRAVDAVTDIAEGKLDLVVNCTSCGMRPKDPFPADPEILGAASIVYDLIYSPAETRFLKEAANRKIPAANGLGMLIQQACTAHCLWFPDAQRQEVLEAMRGVFSK